MSIKEKEARIRQAQARVIANYGSNVGWKKLKDETEKILSEEKPAPSAVKETPVQFSPVYTPRYERQYNMPEIAADNVAPYLREVTLAQKEYDDYVNSQEFQQRKQEAATKLTRNTPMSEVPRNAPQMMETFEDETSKALKAKADYWRNQQDNARTSQIDAENLRKISLMPEEDQKALEAAYTVNLYGRDYENWFEDDKKRAAGWEKYGVDEFNRLLETYTKFRAEEEAEKAQEKARENTSTGVGTFFQNLASLPGKLAGGVVAATGRVGEMATRTGQYPTLTPVLPTDLTSIYYDAVREETGKNIVGEGDSAVRNALGYGYQAGMSAADSLLRLVVLGPEASLGAVAMDSFASGVREATQNGANPAQAYAMATVNAGLEVLTEKVSMDALLTKAKAGATKDLTKFLLNTFGQAGVEISEEEASLIGNTLAEAAILREKSEYNRAIQQLVVDGYSYADAEAMATKAIVDEAKETAIVSGLSGEISGLTATVYSNAVARAEAKTNASQNTQEATGSPQAGVSPETSNDTTKAQSPDAEAAGAPQVGNALTNALDKLVETGNVSNKTVEKILADPAAMEQLSRQTGLDLSQMATASEKRNAVKAAVRQMAGDTAPTTLNREGAQSLIEDMGQELAERAPARQETPEVTPERQAVQNAIDRVLGVDTGTNGNYNAINENPTQGGIENAGAAEQGTAQGAGSQLYGASGEGVRPVQGGTEHYSQSQESGALGQGHLRGSGELLLSETAQKALSGKGSPDVRMYQDSDAQTFVDALNEGRNSDVKNGWCVSPKEVSDLTQPGVKSYLAENGQAGFVINNGDIEAVFTNKAKGAPRGLADSLMLRALSAGGNKLDCYGETLATIYSRYGFEPVARVEFNREVANPGWDASKGEPYVYVMKHNGDSADTVAQKMGTYPEYTKDQLEALPTYGKNDYDAALAYRDSLMGKGSPQVADSSGQSTGGGQAVDTVGMQNEPSGDLEVSRTVSNTGLHSKDADIRQGYKQMVKENPDAGIYDVKHNADTTATAKERTSTPEKVQAEYDYLMGKDAWTAEDLLTAKYVTKNLVHSEIDGAQNQITEMNMKIREIGTNAGQVTQAFAISGTMADLQDSMTAAQRARNAILDMKQEDSTFRQKEGGETYKQWQKDIAKNIDRIAIAVELVDDGDSAGMRDIIRQIARARRTTAWFGKSDNLTRIAEGVLKKLEFDDLKKVASAQLAAMPDDFRARTKKDVALGIKKQNMLSSAMSFVRNIVGNSVGGLTDSASESYGGRMVDMALSKATGKRGIGNDFAHPKEYFQGAKDAAMFASLCVELDIPIETDVDSTLFAAMGDGGKGKYIGKTFRPNGNPAMRFLYGYQKFMSYALEVSDKIFEGGANAAVTESLNDLKKMNLSEEDISRLAEFTANKRTFKDATWEDEDGTHGAMLSRAAVGIKQGAKKIFKTPGEVAADNAMPFASVGMNVTQSGIDYATGIVKGIGEIISIIEDVRAGKEIDVVRQRQAASDVGRGLSGLGIVALFTAAAAKGLLIVNDPEDKDMKALLQAEGRDGAQFNLSGLGRMLIGQDTDLRKTDILIGGDYLEPFNTFMYLGDELAQEDSIWDMAKAYPRATFNAVRSSFLDSPLMTGITNIQELVENVGAAETGKEKLDEVGGYIGESVGSFIPQFVRQTAQFTDGYYRDTRGESATEKAVNKIIAGLPVLSQSLPKKYSGLGEEQKRGGFMSIFADPSKTRVYHENEVTKYLEDLSSSLGGDTSFIPDRQAPMKITVNGEKVSLGGKEREAYQKTYGELVNSYYSRLMGSGVFQGLSDEQKANALKRAESYATEHAKAAVSDYTTDKPRDAAEVTNGIIKDLMRSEFSKAFDTMDADKLDQAYGLYKSLPAADQADFRKETGGRVGYYITAKEAGVSDKAFTGLYGTYKELGDNSGMTNNQKAQEWSRTLAEAYEDGRITKAGHDALKDAMKFRQTYSIDTEKFDAMTESGLSSDVADRIIKGLADLQGTGSVNKDTGKATVTNRDKWGYIAALDGLSDKEKDRVMLLYMPDYNPEAEKPDKTELKYAYLRGRGYSAEQFTQTYGVTKEFTTKADMIAAWVALGYSNEEAQMFYKLYKGKLV